MVLKGPFTGLIRPYTGPGHLLPFVVGSRHPPSCMLVEVHLAAVAWHPQACVLVEVHLAAVGLLGSACFWLVVLWVRLAFVLVEFWARVAVLWARLAFVLGVLCNLA